MSERGLQDAIVTGAGSGIGRAIAHRLAEDGFFVIVADRAEAPAVETVDQIVSRGFNARTEILDITDPIATQALIDGAEHLQVLVNNAGIFNVNTSMN